MDAKYLVVDQPLHVLGILVGRACTRQPPDGRSKPIVRTSGWQLTGSILIGFDRAGCECFVTEALCATFQRDRISEVENPVKGYGARN